jgi:hypothetical protein
MNMHTTLAEENLKALKQVTGYQGQVAAEPHWQLEGGEAFIRLSKESGRALQHTLAPYIGSGLTLNEALPGILGKHCCEVRLSAQAMQKAELAPSLREQAEDIRWKLLDEVMKETSAFRSSYR